MVRKQKLLYEIKYAAYGAQDSDTGRSWMLLKLLLHLQRKMNTENLPQREFLLHMC